MINNKQVNIWRGDQEPPTIYHVWIYNDLVLKLYDGNEWVTFLDDASVITKLNEVINKVDSLEEFMNNSTINNHKIKDNPVLDGTDLKTASSGLYIQQDNTIANALSKLDKLLQTEIIQ